MVFIVFVAMTVTVAWNTIFVVEFFNGETEIAFLGNVRQPSNNVSCLHGTAF